MVKKIIKLTILILFFLFEAFLMSDIFYRKIISWQGEVISSSPDGKYILTIKSDNSNYFEAGYSITLVGSDIDFITSPDLYIYECREEPSVIWQEDTVIVKCSIKNGETAEYVFIMEDNHEEEKFD